MFDKMKQLMDVQKKMQQAKLELENTSFDILSEDGLVKITMSAAQVVKEVSLNSFSVDDKAILERSLKDAYNRAIKHSQELAAEKMKNIVGFNIPGLT